MSKAVYIGAGDLAKKIKKMYVGVNTEVPIYGADTSITEDLSADNANSVFTVTTGTDTYTAWTIGTGDTLGEIKLTPGNLAAAVGNGKTAAITMVAKSNITGVVMRGSYNTGSSSPLTLTVSGETVLNAVTGSDSFTWQGRISAGGSINITYTKKVGNATSVTLYLACDKVTYTTVAQVGTETKVVARKVKRGYIGVNGIAHKFFGGELKYYGTTALTEKSYLPVGSANENYALFAIVGTKITSGVQYTQVGNAFNEQLTRSELTIPNSVREGKGVKTADYAFFAGGYNTGSGSVGTVLVYDKSLTQSSAADLAQGVVRSPAGAKIGEYVLFGGSDYNYGSTTSNTNTRRTVSAYDQKTLTQITTEIDRPVSGLCGAGNGKYAIFLGGAYRTTTTSSGTEYINRTYWMFDKALTQSNYTNESIARYNWGERAGAYAVFSDNDTENKTTKTMAIDKQGTMRLIDSLSIRRTKMATAEMEGNALFAGGATYGEGSDAQYLRGDTAIVDVYDDSLTHRQMDNLSAARNDMAGTTVGDYVLFGGGGFTSGNTDTDVVDIYEFN